MDAGSGPSHAADPFFFPSLTFPEDATMATLNSPLFFFFVRCTAGRPRFSIASDFFFPRVPLAPSSPTLRIKTHCIPSPFPLSSFLPGEQDRRDLSFFHLYSLPSFCCCCLSFFSSRRTCTGRGETAYPPPFFFSLLRELVAEEKPPSFVIRPPSPLPARASHRT